MAFDISPGVGSTAVSGASFFMFRIMAQEYASRFYKSQAWKNCSKAYKESVGGLCENCNRNGLIVAGAIVHHKIHITPENINNTEVSLNWDNLELLCRNCHAAIHKGKRYKINSDGSIAPIF